MLQTCRLFFAERSHKERLFISWFFKFLLGDKSNLCEQSINPSLIFKSVPTVENVFFFIKRCKHFDQILLALATVSIASMLYETEQNFKSFSHRDIREDAQIAARNTAKNTSTDTWSNRWRRNSIRVIWQSSKSTTPPQPPCDCWAHRVANTFHSVHAGARRCRLLPHWSRRSCDSRQRTLQRTLSTSGRKRLDNYFRARRRCTLARCWSPIGVQLRNENKNISRSWLINERNNVMMYDLGLNRFDQKSNANNHQMHGTNFFSNINHV